MITNRITKAITGVTTKLSPAAEDVLRRNMDKLTLTPAEEHEVGMEVARAMERRSADPTYQLMKFRGLPTPEEAEAIAAAEAGYTAALARATELRAVAMEAETAVKRTTGRMDGGSAADRLQGDLEQSRARNALAAAEADLQRADLDVQIASRALQRARGAAIRAGALRQRVFVATGGLDA